LRRGFESAVWGLTWYQVAALAIVMSVGVAAMVASRAAFAALWARYPRGLSVAGSLLLLHGLALVLLALAAQRGIGPEISPDEVFGATSWLAAAVVVLATVYLCWASLAERLLTLGQACGAVLVSAAFGTAWVTMLRAAGVQLSAMPATEAIWLLSPALLPLAAGVLSPWSFSRVRHT
jgi:hypothetical protein